MILCIQCVQAILSSPCSLTFPNLFRPPLSPCLLSPESHSACFPLVVSFGSGLGSTAICRERRSWRPCWILPCPSLVHAVSWCASEHPSSCLLVYSTLLPPGFTRTNPQTSVSSGLYHHCLEQLIGKYVFDEWNILFLWRFGVKFEKAKT